MVCLDAGKLHRENTTITPNVSVNQHIGRPNVHRNGMRQQSVIQLLCDVMLHERDTTQFKFNIARIEQIFELETQANWKANSPITGIMEFSRARIMS
jgi:hypothetical protein